MAFRVTSGLHNLLRTYLHMNTVTHTHTYTHILSVYLFTVSASTVKTISPEFTWKITLSTFSSMRPVIIIGSFLIPNWTPLVHTVHPTCTVHPTSPSRAEVKGGEGVAWLKG